MKKYQDKINWYILTSRKQLSINLIEKFSYKCNLNWSEISSYNNLPENFIEKYKDKIDWFYISRDQKLSNKFISKYINKLDLNILNTIQNENIDQEFVEKLLLLK